jgi:hypothetical protein
MNRLPKRGKMKLRVEWCLLLLLCSSIYAAEYRVEADNTPVYAEPSTTSANLGLLHKGKRLHSSREQGEFLRVKSRSGRDLWIQKSRVTAVSTSDAYDVSTDVQSEVPVFEPTFKRLRLDIGASGGSMAGEGFAEIALGLEYFMMERLSWRNAVFYRLNRTQPDIMGLDSSVRGNGNLPLGALRLRGIIGAGFRFATRGQEAPFVELGGLSRFRDFELGFMLKYLVPVSSPHPNVAIYSLVFSGAAGFF